MQVNAPGKRRLSIACLEADRQVAGGDVCWLHVQRERKERKTRSVHQPVHQPPLNQCIKARVSASCSAAQLSEHPHPRTTPHITPPPMATIIPAQGSRSPQLSLSFAPASPLSPSRPPSFIAVQPPTPTRDGSIAEKTRSADARTSTANELGSPPSPFPTPRRGTILQEFRRRSLEGVPPPSVKYLHPNDATKPITALVVSPPTSPRNSTYSAAGAGQQRRSWRISRASRATTVEEPEIFEASDADLGEHGRRMKEHQQRRQRGHRRTRSEQTQRTYMSSTRESMGSRISRILTQEDFIMAALEKRRRRDYTIGSRHPMEAPPPSVQQRAEEEEEDPYYLVDLMKKVWSMPWIADPIVSTLVIHRTGDEFPESWFKPKYMDADELAEEGLAGVPRGSAIGDPVNVPATNVQAPEPAYVGIWKAGVKRAFGG